MKTIIKVIIISCILAVLILVLKNNFTCLIPNPNYGMSALIKQKKVENVFIGSSVFRQGLDIFEIEKRLGENSFILAYNGNQPVLMRQELEYMLNNGLEINNLYLDLYCSIATEKPWFSDTRILWDTDIQFKLELWGMMSVYGNAEAKDFYEMFVSANNEYLLTYLVTNALVSGRYYKGGNTTMAEGAEKEILEAKNIDESEREKEILAVQKKAYQDIFILCKEKNINIVCLEVPKYEKMAQDENYQRLNSELVEMLKSAEVKYILAENVEFDNDNAIYYQDHVHLSSEGRRAYTESLIKAIGASNG